MDRTERLYHHKSPINLRSEGPLWATDRNGAEIKMEDGVKEFGGEEFGIERECWCICARTTSVQSVSLKGGRIASNASSPDLSSMNPAMKLNPKNNGQMLPPKSFGRDKSIGRLLQFEKVHTRVCLALSKIPTDTNARVELHTKSKVVSVPKDCLGFKDKISGLPERTPGWGRTLMVVDKVGERLLGSLVLLMVGGHLVGLTMDLELCMRMMVAEPPMEVQQNSCLVIWCENQLMGYLIILDRELPHMAAVVMSETHGFKTPAYPANNSSDNWNSGQSNNNNWGSAYDAPTPGGPLSAPTPAAMNAPTPGGYSAPTPAAMNAPTPSLFGANPSSRLLVHQHLKLWMHLHRDKDIMQVLHPRCLCSGNTSSGLAG
ncbi:hypothetical protein EYC84_007129 [Monilinia fructicola]|uniref:Spt5 KOW domain-containing protein n=1 Tax=Monilinia fructicola TaxID=38448 RepID=A0A5M9K5M5_MONFR|nr:hypothetical protein EYC84_007129 [Monilinia fructicola]